MIAREVLAWFRHGDDGLTGWQRRQAARRYRRIALSPPTARELAMLRQWRAEAEDAELGTTPAEFDRMWDEGTPA